MNKEVRQFCRRLESRGWQWGMTGSGHVKFTHPCGRCFITSSTPSEKWRWRKNVEREARVIEEWAIKQDGGEIVEIEEAHDPEELMKKAQEKLGEMAELSAIMMAELTSIMKRVRPWM